MADFPYSSAALLVFAVAALLAVIVVGVLLWRRPDTGLRIKHKESEFQLEPSQADSDVDRHPTHTRPTEVGEELIAESSVEEVEHEESLGDAYQLLVADKYVEGMKILERNIASLTDTREQVAQRAFGQYVVASRGDDQALSDLTQTAMENPGASEVQFWLGLAKRELGRVQEALEAYRAALDSARDDQDRRRVLTSIANVTAETQGHDVAASELIVATRSLTDPSVKATLLGTAAKMYLGAEPPKKEIAFSLYESALRLAPTDRSLRQDVAWAYGEHDSPAFSYLHYKQSDWQDSSQALLANNLGVAASNIGLESEAVECYRLAESNGETLAAANLAWKLIQAGFLTEARDRLEAAQGAETVHRNVLSALGGVAKQQSDEEASSANILDRARKIQRWRASDAEYLASGRAVSLAEGTYRGSGGTLVLSHAESGVYTGELRRLLDVLTVTATLEYSCLKLVWIQKAPEAGPGLLGFSLPRNTGYGRLFVEENKLVGYIADGRFSLDPWNAKDWTEIHLTWQSAETQLPSTI